MTLPWIVGLLLSVAVRAQAGDDSSSRVELKRASFSAEEISGRTSALRAGLPSEDTGAWIVSFSGPADAPIREAIRAAGGRIVGYLPHCAYLVRGDGDFARLARENPSFRSVDPFFPEWKLAEGIGAVRRDVRALAEDGLQDGETILTVDVFEGEDVGEVAEKLRAEGFDIVRVHETPLVRRIVVRAFLDESSRWEQMASFPEVEWIEEAPRVQLRNDVVRWVIQSNVENETPLYDAGLLGQGQIAGLIDGPVFLNSCFFRDDLVALPGPDHRKLVGYHSTSGFGAHSHGTHVAGILAGDQEPLNGSVAFRGMAPKARIAFSNYFDVTGFGNVVSNLAQVLTQNHDDGARVHTNSWGQDGRTDYVTWCRDIDLFTRANEDDLVLFAVSNTSFLGVPENAKNCLAVGATLRPPSQNNIGSAGAGPTNDGRRKPEVFAPGISTASASANLDCAVVNSSGTSMSSPAVAGGALLVREYFMRGYYPTGVPRPAGAHLPTGALVKAAVINSGQDLIAEATYPGDREGWGRILLEDVLYFPGDPERLWFRDVRHAEGLATGETDAFVLKIVSSSEPLRLTMVYTDQPAALAANPATVNDLDLEVEGPDGLFLGNVFNELVGVSETGGSADSKNNVERVILASPTPGNWTVRVHGQNVPLGPQGFALVANGGLFPLDRREVLSPDEESNETSRVALPGSVELQSPHPNPFVESAKYSLAVPQAVSLRLSIHDVTGRLVKTLLDRTVEAGRFDLTWDGKDEAGAAVPPGIYFARLVGPGVNSTVKGVRLH